jgi:hypothetical protein
VDNLDDGQEKSSLLGYRRHPAENHFYCDRERSEDWRPEEAAIPTMEEAVTFLGEPPRQENLPDWLTEEPPLPKVRTNSEFFIVLPEALLHDHELNAKDREVWAEYYRYCEPKDLSMINPGVTFVGQGRIAKNLGCSVVTVRTSTAKLIKIGWISVKKRAGFTNLTAVNYRKQKDYTPIKNYRGAKKEKGNFTPL